MYNCLKTHNLTKDCTLLGSSICAKETGFIIKEKNIALDCGFYSITDYQVKYIFITHEHYDHTANLIRYLYNIKDKDMTKKEIYIIAHNSMIEYIKNIISAEFDKKHKSKIHKKYIIISVKYGEKLLIDFKNNKIEKINNTNKCTNLSWIIDVFYCYHTVPCVGYGFSEFRTYLNPKYKNYNGNELKKIKESGIDISLTKSVPLFCYLGDTNHKLFYDDNKDYILSYPNIIVECSFILNEHINEAIKKKHMHWNNLKKVIDSNKDITFILIHFSQRYYPWKNNGENIVKSKLKDYINKKNILAWIN